MDIIRFGGREYFVFLGLLILARGLDFFSTWLASPKLLLEANPIARRLGWKWGLSLNALLCGLCACWPLLAIIWATTSLLVGARNLQFAWLMRLMGETQYQRWISEMLAQASFGFYAACVLMQALVFVGLGIALILVGLRLWPALAIGMGLVTYGLAVALYSLLSAWRMAKRQSLATSA